MARSSASHPADHLKRVAMAAGSGSDPTLVLVPGKALGSDGSRVTLAAAAGGRRPCW
jgi:hypothetical protein